MTVIQVRFKFRVFFMIRSNLKSEYMTVDSTDMLSAVRLLESKLTPEQQETLFSVVPLHLYNRRVYK